MSWKANVTIGFALYFLALLLANTFFEPLPMPQLDATLLLVIVCMGVFFLSLLFYGRLSFATAFFAGAMLGAGFAVRPIFSLLAVVPVVNALGLGAEIGDQIALDLKGKANFQEALAKRWKTAIIVIALALIVGIFTSNITLEQLRLFFGNFDLSEIDKFIGSRRLQ